MYCPKCSQRQVSDEVHFCPRCGFQLDALKTLVAQDQSIAAGGEAGPLSQLTPARKRDMLLGATGMLFGSILITLLTVSAVAGTPLQAVIIPLLLVWAALVAALLLSGHAARELARLFSKDASAPLPRASSGFDTRVGAAPQRQTLQPSHSAPAQGLGAWRTITAELVQPKSITEHTTDLLEGK